MNIFFFTAVNPIGKKGSGVSQRGTGFRKAGAVRASFYQFTVLILAFAVCLTVAADAAEAGRTIPLRFFSSDDGLVFNEVLTGYQEKSRGYIWFCTYGGLSRFDGKRFVNFKGEKGGLGGMLIRDITEDSENTIWVGFIGGVAKFSEGEIVNYTEADGLVGSDVSNLWPDPVHGVWALTDKGVCHIADGVFTSYTMKNIEIGFFNKLTGSPEGDVYVLTRDGVLRKRPDHDQFELIMKPEFPASSIRFNAGENALYIVGSSALYRYAQERIVQVSESPLQNDLRNIEFADNGDFWINSENEVWLIRHGQENVHFTSDMLGNLAIADLFQDREGHIWLASWSGAAMIVNTSILHYSDLPEPTVSRIIPDREGNLWVGSSKGVFKMDPDGRILKTIQTSFVEYLYIVDDRVYTCLSDQISVYDLEGNRLQSLKKSVDDETYYSCIMRDSSGKFWVGSYNGLHSVNENGEIVLELNTENGLKSNSVQTLLEDGRGRIWVGAEKGLSCLENGDWSHYDTEDGLSHSTVWHLNHYQEDGVLLATGKGINIYQNGRFSKVSGLGDVPIGSVAAQENGVIWASNRNGLYRLDRNGEVDLHLNKDRGLPCDSMYYRTIFIDNGGLYMGGHKGAFRVDLDIQRQDGVGPLVEIRKVNLNNEPVPVNRLKMPLEHFQRNITFHFDAIYFFLPESISYSYILEGNDTQWSKNSLINQAVYTNLSPGDYTFKCRAEAEGGKSSPIRTIRFKITKAYWQTGWFYSIVVFLGIGAIIGLVVFTLRVRIRRSEEYAKVLEERVKARTIELSETNRNLTQEINQRKMMEAELRKAKETADYANKSKSDFLAHMSHEIRTPMNVILGLTDMIRETGLSPEQSKYLSILGNSGKSLVALINDVLDLSKIEAGLLELDETEFDINSVISSVCELMRVRATEKGLDFYCNIHSDIPNWLIGDSMRLKQILMNLISNALKFTEKGEIKLEVVCLSKKTNENEDRMVELLFSVSDTGIGIPVERQGGIFGRYIQADSSTAGKFGGSGLGLTISKQFVEMMQGSIWVESEPGKGSRFMFTGMFKVGEQGGVKSSHIPLNLGMAMKPPKILLVEDNEENRMVFSFYISKIPHELIVAVNGREAIDKNIAEKPDVIFMDLEMPVMDGISAVRLIREWEKENNADPVVIIGLSARALKEDREKCYQAGMDDYLSKPFDFEELFTVLMRWVKAADKQILINKKEEAIDTKEWGDDIPDELPGLKVKDGVKRFMYKIDAYHRIIKKFLSGYENFEETMAEFLKDGDTRGLQRYVHTVKGIAGNLSANELFGMSDAVETMLKQGKTENIDSQIEHYVDVYQEAVDSMKRLSTMIESMESDKSGT